MGKGEDLGRPGIGSVDEHHWRQVVDEGKAPELVRIERAMRVATDDAIGHHQDAGLLGVLPQSVERLTPVRELDSTVEAEAELLSQGVRRMLHGRVEPLASHKLNRLSAVGLGVVPVPHLALLTGVDGVE